MSQSDFRALLQLAKSVERLLSALERVKPESIREDETIFEGTFDEDLTVARQALENMLKELGVWREE